MEEDSACVYVFFCLHVQRTHVQAHANLSAIADMQTSMHACTYTVCVAVCACAFARVRVWPCAGGGGEVGHGLKLSPLL